MIVMQKSIPDLVAQEFLKHFLTAFGRGQSLYLAVREARERLQGMESDFPCATWLPVIFQNPACKPLTLIPHSNTHQSPVSNLRLSSIPVIWLLLREINSAAGILFLGKFLIPKGDEFGSRHRDTPKVQTALMTTFLVASSFLGMRHLGWLQPLELKAYDQMMRSRPDEPEDNRIVVVEVDADGIKYEHEQKKGDKKSSLTVSTLKQVVGEIQKYQPQFIGLVQDLDTPDKEIYKQKLEKILEKNSKLYLTCSTSKNINESEALGNLPNTENAFGFSDVSRDDDTVLRRSLLAMGIDESMSSSCKIPNAFSLMLALKYLEQVKGINYKSLPDGKIKILNPFDKFIEPIKHRRLEGFVIQFLDALRQRQSQGVW